MSIIQNIPFGRENAISRPELARRAGMPDRKAREAVSAYRAAWVPAEPFICSDSADSGYWLTCDAAEIRAFREWYGSYTRTSGRLLNNIDRQLAKLDGTGLVYVQAHYRRIRAAKE